MADEAYLNTIRNTLNDYADLSVREMESRAKNAAGGSWLVALAALLGKIADNMGDNLVAMAKKIDAAQHFAANNPKAKNNLTELNAEMNAFGQIMNMFMQTVSTIIKSIGEGNTQIARKSG